MFFHFTFNVYIFTLYVKSWYNINIEILFIHVLVNDNITRTKERKWKQWIRMEFVYESVPIFNNLCNLL